MKKKINRLIILPTIIISLIICISGIRWMINPEPWLLDQVANEERLAMTFNELFLIEGNETLGGYLKQIYRFLGLYVFGTGFVFLLFSTDKLTNSKFFRNRYLFALGLLLISNIILGYYWIPSSHFIYIMWGAILLYLISLYNHITLAYHLKNKQMTK